jgi:hypothetical protein
MLRVFYNREFTPKYLAIHVVQCFSLLVPIAIYGNTLQGDVEAMHYLWGVTSLHLKKAMLKTKSICMHVLPCHFIWKGLEHMCHLATSFEKD